MSCDLALYSVIWRNKTINLAETLHNIRPCGVQYKQSTHLAQTGATGVGGGAQAKEQALTSPLGKQNKRGDKC